MLALLARTDRQGLAYAGAAFIALSGNERDELRIRLESIKSGRCPLARLRMPTAQWVKPQLVARVRHLAGAKRLRHATVRGSLADRGSDYSAAQLTALRFHFGGARPNTVQPPSEQPKRRKGSKEKDRVESGFGHGGGPYAPNQIQSSVLYIASQDSSSN
jgi:hypothetical protein